MIEYLMERLKEKSTWTGGAAAISALFAWNIPDSKVQAAFIIATFILGAVTAGMKEKGQVMAHSGTLIDMRNVPGKPNNRELIAPLKYVKFGGGVGVIPVGFEWDGSSVPWIFQQVFPRHRHPIASCRHDWRCRKAQNMAERLFADKEFERDVGTTSWWITKKLGYWGVRIGAYLGIGKYY